MEMRNGLPPAAPCGFCGGALLRVVDGGGAPATVQCLGCGAIGPQCEDRAAAIEAWNERVPVFVSVEHKMPNENEWLLACGDGAMMTMGYDNGAFRDWSDSPAPNLAPHLVTHWMRLPRMEVKDAKRK